jgi:TOMM system kinase/cyclase fusion protein
MDFYAVLDQIVDLLRRRGRVSYRALQRQFGLDDDYVADLKVELIDVQQVAVDQAGKMLVWLGDAGTPSEPALKPSQSEQPPPTSPPPEAERRQLTVLFCDLVDSTVLASQLDPEEWREVVRAYQDTCAKVIARFEGHIAQYLGDGLLVYFGYPLAHEDDAQRAVRAGLGMVEAVGQLNTRLERERGVSLAVRLGIHTGQVVVGEIGGGTKHEQLALGETPNVAARLQGVAAPNTVVISAATYRLVQGYFTVATLGPQPLKGVAAPLPVYRILGASAAWSRLDVAKATGLTPLVGRESDMALLLERWEQSKAGMGQVVLLSGEAGIGKSRLVESLTVQLGSEAYTRLTFRCSPYAQQSALHPVIEYLQHWLPGGPTGSPEAKLDALEQVLQTYGLRPAESVPLMAALLSVPLPAGRYPPLRGTPLRQREQMFDTLTTWLLRATEQQPVLTVCEDLHWADPSTLELLRRLIDQAPKVPLLTVLTCRPEFHPPWPSRAHVTRLTLNRLTSSQVELMVARVTGGKGLPATVVEHVVGKTDGVPLFVEELTKMVLESGLLRERNGRYELTGPLPPLAIPVTLHDSLMARLDRLAAVKEVAQLAATLGREFPYELLKAVSPVNDATLQPALVRLVDAGLLYQQGVPPQATYRFKHALIQDAAYQALLKSRRQRVHQRIAQVLEERFPEICITQPELLAHHYTQAGFSSQAVRYWQRAGQRAVQHSAYAEVISHLTTALALLRTLPDTPERTQQELDLQIALGPALMATKGQAAPEVEQAYARARVLCQQVGETPQLFPALWGLASYYLMKPELQTSRELGEQMLRLALRAQDRALLLEAHRSLGTTLFESGALVEAQAHLEQGMALYHPQQHRAHTVRYGRDPGVVCLSYGAHTRWLLGYPDQALHRIHDALTLYGQSSHPFSFASALFYAAILSQLCRNAQAAREQAEVLMTVATEEGFALRLANGMIIHGWAVVAQRAGEQGLAEMRQGLSAYEDTGAYLTRSYFLALLAEGYGQVGQPTEGLSVLTTALASMQRYGDRFFEAELYRLKGDLLLALSGAQAGEAEACFQRALEIARHQQAKSLELRAALSLSYLWQQQGKQERARHLLAEIYDWFTEGFDTADLQEAKALLETLS